jgi:hypothetical protein
MGSGSGLEYHLELLLVSASAYQLGLVSESGLELVSLLELVSASAYQLELVSGLESGLGLGLGSVLVSDSE